MAFTIFLSALLLLSSASSEDTKTENLQDFNSLVNCFTDALVLEGIAIKACMGLAAGIYVEEAIQGLKKFWSLIPEWLGVCKGIFSSEVNLELDFPEIENEVVEELKNSNVLGSTLPGPTFLVPKDCFEGVMLTAKNVYWIGLSLKNKRFEEAAMLANSVEQIATTVINNCGR